MSTELTADGRKHIFSKTDEAYVEHPFVWLDRAQAIAKERDEALAQLKELRTACPELTADGKAIRSYNETHAHPTYADYVWRDRALAAVAEERRKREAATNACRKLITEHTQRQRERDEARAAMASVRAEAATRQERLSMALLAAEAENARLRQLLKLSKEIVDYVAETLPMRNCDPDEPSSFPLMRCWVSASMVMAARDIQLALAPPAQPAAAPAATDCSGPLPGRNVVVVQTPDKTVFITPPEESEPAPLDPTLREPLKACPSFMTPANGWVSASEANARIAALVQEIDRLQALADFQTLRADTTHKVFADLEESEHQKAAHIAGEPARTRAAVVEELRRQGDLWIDQDPTAANVLYHRADKLEREYSKEGGDASR